jgi:hypothetical protein
MHSLGKSHELILATRIEIKQNFITCILEIINRYQSTFSILSYVFSIQVTFGK